MKEHEKNLQKYINKGAPKEIYHGEYKGVLVDIQPLVDGLCCGIYRFKGGDTIGGPTVQWYGDNN